MLKFDDTATIFVKGFAQKVDYDVLLAPSDCHGEFIAIITDLVTSGQVKITSATMDNGKWVLKCTDGKILTLEQEPNVPRELTHCKLVTNFVQTFMGDRYDVVLPKEYDDAIKAISSGDKSYVLVGHIGSHKIRTSSLVKFWIDSNGKKHGITKSGSHYVF